MDRLIFVGLYRLVPNTIEALTIVKSDTVIRWHRAGFRVYGAGKSRRRCAALGSAENPWRAAQARHRDRPDQRRQIYSAEEGPSLARMEDVPSPPCGGIVAMDLFVVPPSAPRSAVVHELLQRHAHSPIIEQGRAASRAAETTGRILCHPVLGGLHHQYARI
jgi:hypothetical protein